MAGIGFQLHKLIEDESFLNKAKAYIFASIITSGPWILSILCLALIGALSGKFLQGEKFSHVSITIVYTFAFSLILTGPVQFTLTRYLADKEYLKQKDRMFSGLVTALLIAVVVAAGVSIGWYYYIESSFAYKLIGIALFMVICAIWTMMDFLSCSKNYGGIISSFFIGSIGSLVAAPLLGNVFGLEGALGGYALGQLFILVMLLYFIAKEFSLDGIINTEFLSYFRLVPYIFFTGLFYNLGLWVDKLLGWYFKGEVVFSNFIAFGLYDTPIFIAYLSIIPSLAYFLIQSETSFYLAHRTFFDSISHESLYAIIDYKNNLIKILKKSIFTLFVIQFVTSLLGALFAYPIAHWFGIQAESVPVLRILFFAAGAQVMFLYVIIFLMYFDLSRTSFYLVFLFFILNGALNLVNFIFDLTLAGVAYCTAISLSFLTGIILLMLSVYDVEYKIFMNQE